MKALGFDRRAGLTVFVLIQCCTSAFAYTGGPVRAHIAGFDTATNRVYYYRTFLDESGAPPEFWFYDLDAESTSNAQRATFLDFTRSDPYRGEYVMSQAWRALSPQLLPLISSPNFHVQLTLRVDSVGVDTSWHSPLYRAHLEIEASGLSAVRDLTIFCEPMIAIRGIYLLPGQKSAIVMLSYIGRTHYCEEVDEPILLTANCALSAQSERASDDALDTTYKHEPFVFGRKSMRGLAARHFIAKFFESMATKTTGLSCLTWKYGMVSYPEVWMIDPSREGARPIALDLYNEHAAACDWDLYLAILRLAARRADLVARAEVDLDLQLSVESSSTDSATGHSIHNGHLVVRTPLGKGEASLRMFCNTIIWVRGVFPLPQGCELVIVTYTADPSGCEENEPPLCDWNDSTNMYYDSAIPRRGKKEIPIIIYPER